jgi:hypothetical protein
MADAAARRGREEGEGLGKKTVDLVTSQPVVITYPLALALATGLAQMLGLLLDAPVLWALITAVMLSLAIYGLDWLNNRQDWHQDPQEQRVRFWLYLFLNTAILWLSQTTDVVKNILTAG